MIARPHTWIGVATGASVGSVGAGSSTSTSVGRTPSVPGIGRRPGGLTTAHDSKDWHLFCFVVAVCCVVVGCASRVNLILGSLAS